MKVTLTSRFFFQNLWFEPGTEIEGAAAEAAIAAGAADAPAVVSTDDKKKKG